MSDTNINTFSNCSSIDCLSSHFTKTLSKIEYNHTFNPNQSTENQYLKNKSNKSDFSFKVLTRLSNTHSSDVYNGENFSFIENNTFKEEKTENSYKINELLSDHVKNPIKTIISKIKFYSCFEESKVNVTTHDIKNRSINKLGNRKMKKHSIIVESQIKVIGDFVPLHQL
jgi:hypothetical protein